MPTKRQPSPAQLRARKKFLAAAKARVKAIRAAKRNTTNIRARKIDHLDVSKVHNPRRGFRGVAGHAKATKKKLEKRGEIDAAAIARAVRKHDAKIKGAQRRPVSVTRQLEQRKNAKVVSPALRSRRLPTRQYEVWARPPGESWRQLEPVTAANQRAAYERLRKAHGDWSFQLTLKPAKRKNAEHRDARHPIHVTDYWQGRKGYKTQWQRAHEGGQRQLFAVKNPKAFSKATVIGSQLWKALPADEKAALIRQMSQINRTGWQQAKTVKLIQRVTGATKQPAAYIASFAKIAHTVPLAVIKKAQAAGDPGIIDAYRKNGKRVVSRAARSSDAGASLARKRRAEFVGRPSKKTISSYAPKGSGARPHSTLVAMGKLKKVFVKGRAPLNFQGAALLAHDPKSDQMFILGKDYSLRKIRRNPEGVEDLGEVTRIEYEATKTHLGDDGPVTYFHKLGEEGGELPHAIINEENLLILSGGDYYITPEGIRD